MSKLLTIVPNLEYLKETDLSDAYLFGIEKLSINMPFYITVEQLKQIVKSTTKEIFISLNKNIHNNELPLLEQTMKQLKNIEIKGIFYYDASIIYINQEHQLDFNLIWAAEHLTTSFETINFWMNQGVYGTYLSTSINKQEILDMKKNTKSKLFLPAFGYMPMFTSKRPLLTSYLKKFNIKTNTENKKLYKEEKEYIIDETEVGTTVYTSSILNLFDYIDTLKDIDYLVLNSYKIKNFKQVISSFKNKTGNIENIIEEKTDTHKFNEHVIYKVKK